MNGIQALCFVLISASSSQAFAETIELDLPKVTVPAAIAAAKAAFAEDIKLTVGQVNSGFPAPITVLAPFGGSKISPIRELDADGLVIVSWERPGTVAAVTRSFRQDAQELQKVLTAALASGGMSSVDVGRVPVAAQIIGRLAIELGVQTVTVEYYLPVAVVEEIGNGAALPNLWDGANLGDDDFPLLMRFSFAWQGRSREVVFLSWKLAADHAPRSSMPLAPLRHLLNTRRYKWGYFSADGLIAFSANAANGFRKGNQEILKLLAPTAAVILDYPTHPAYHVPSEHDGLISMSGRADLQEWDMRRLHTTAVELPVFGYAGYHEGDEVRIYQRRPADGKVRPKPPAAAEIFFWSDFLQIGSSQTFTIKASL